MRHRVDFVPLAQSSLTADHWAVRDEAAALVGFICATFRDPYYNITPRVSRTLLKAFLDPSKPLTTHYGDTRRMPE
jgi:transcription initiation factor TFIID subunit 6